MTNSTEINKLATELKKGDCIEVGGLLYEIHVAKPNAHHGIILELSLLAIQPDSPRQLPFITMLILPETAYITTV